MTNSTGKPGLLLACLLLLTGCLGPRARCRVSAANASDRTLTSVLVRDTAGVPYAFGALKPRSAAPPVPTRGDLGTNAVVEVTGEDGLMTSHTVRLGRVITPSFAGSVVFQVETNGLVRSFILPSSGRRESDLPWAVPPSWQGVVSIPGLGDQN